LLRVTGGNALADPTLLRHICIAGWQDKACDLVQLQELLWPDESAIDSVKAERFAPQALAARSASVDVSRTMKPTPEKGPARQAPPLDAAVDSSATARSGQAACSLGP